MSDAFNNEIAQVKRYLLDFQQRLIQALAAEETKATFKLDPWEHIEKGGGITGVLSDGATLEKAAANFSHVAGMTLPKAATLKRPELADHTFEALGVSTIVHPRNPYVPTTHANVRLVVVNRADQAPLWWFGGGFDLTPYYGFKEDCVHWHKMAKAACDPFGSDVYPKFKKWCDDYFYLPHRAEPRGIGGLFFDDLNNWGFDRCFEFIKSVAEHFIWAYQSILSKRKDTSYGERERQFQRYRRGRYVEFNLLYDRGTLFGLQSGGRTESILVSLPPEVSWHYQWQPEPGSPEAELYSEFLKVREWV